MFKLANVAPVLMHPTPFVAPIVFILFEPNGEIGRTAAWKPQIIIFNEFPNAVVAVLAFVAALFVDIWNAHQYSPGGNTVVAFQFNVIAWFALKAEVPLDAHDRE